MNKKLLFALLAIFGAWTLLSGCKSKPAPETEKLGVENMAYKLGKIALEATANDTDRFRPRPTVTSRILALVFTSVYDAWSRYDSAAAPVYLSGVDRRPENERTLANKETAISYAAFRAMIEYFWADSTVWKQRMSEMGLDPENRSLDPSTPEGIGNLAARAVIEARRNDGANQYGQMEGSNGTPYSDFTGYQPVNDPDNNVDLMRWQPKYFSDDKGGKFAPACLTPHWQMVQPLLLDSSSQFRSPPPPALDSEQLALEVKEVIDLQAKLTPEEKALVEFMRDGPRSVQQAGHWLIFAQDVSRRDQHNLDQDVKMYFLVTAAAMDAFIACWDTKMFYDYARPYALVHQFHKDQTIKGWGGPDAGWIEMKGQQWRPYSPDNFLCPPFPAYVSGHSTVSGACSKTLELFTGNDRYGESVKLVPGALTEPNNLGDTVTLHFNTFTQTAEMAGISRVLGGYHIQADNLEGLSLGRTVGEFVFEKTNRYFSGKVEK